MNSFSVLCDLFIEKSIEQDTFHAELRASNYRIAPEEEFPCISDLMVVFIVLKGSMQITIDGQKYICTNKTNNLLDVKPFNRIESLQPGKGMHGIVVAISRTFMNSALHGNRPVHHSFFRFIGCVYSLKRSEISILLEYFRLVRLNTGTEVSALDKFIYQHSILLFHAKVIKMIENYQNPGIQQKQEISRPAFLCSRYFSLLEAHVFQEHSVSFYARKLNITPHYLTKICQNYASKSASQAIADLLIIQASILLRNPQLSIQQIADKLNFCDTSSFGKFFRKHTGKSPSEFRKDTAIPWEDPDGSLS